MKFRRNFKEDLYLKNRPKTFSAEMQLHKIDTSSAAQMLSGSPAHRCRSWKKNPDRCYDFLNIFAEKIWRKKWRFLLKTKPNYAKIGS
jgi:hypothetical protein